MASPRNYIVEAYNSLSRDINKLPGHTSYETTEGVVSIIIPELSVEMENSDIIKLLNKFEKNWVESDVYAEWVKRGDENVNYWKGKHFQRPETDKTRALVDNVIFESVETSIPQYISRNPEPDVELRRSELLPTGEPSNPVYTMVVDRLQNELGDLGDELRLRMKMKKVARHWALNLLGVGKVGWDVTRDIPIIKVVRPRKIILDPDATVDEDGYTGELIGEYRELPAYKILPFCTEPQAKELIKELSKGELATKLQFIEFWSDTVLIWKIGTSVLMKRENPHWNWQEGVQDLESDFMPVGLAPEGVPTMPQLPEAGEAPDKNAPGKPTLPAMKTAGLGTREGGETGASDEVDNTGEYPPTTEPSENNQIDQGQEGTTEGQAQPPEGEQADIFPVKNHFPAPRKPYLFLVMLNLGDQPVDNTSLITQNLSNQDIINKRNKQIDHNADYMNGGLIVSLEKSGLTAQQAKGVSEAYRKGGVVGIPVGAPQEAVWRPDIPGLPADVYNNLNDLRGRVVSIFGVRGSVAQPLTASTTVRGQIMNRTLDTDRIGGGISEILEQFADDAYNWFVQLKLVHEDFYKQLVAEGSMPDITVTIKEGSLLPKDKVTLANQAIELAGSGKMALLDLYKALDYANAEEMAVNAWLEGNAPDLLYPNDPRVAQAVQRQAQAAQAMEAAKHPPEHPKPPSISIAYKDLPPDGQAQAAAQAGVILHPEGITAHNQFSNPPDGSNGAGSGTLDQGVSPTPQ